MKKWTPWRFKPLLGKIQCLSEPDAGYTWLLPLSTIALLVMANNMYPRKPPLCCTHNIELYRVHLAKDKNRIHNFKGDRHIFRRHMSISITM